MYLTYRSALDGIPQWRRFRRFLKKKYLNQKRNLLLEVIFT